MPKKCNYQGCQYNQFGGGYCPYHQNSRTDERYLRSQARQRQKKIDRAWSYTMPKITKKQQKRDALYNARVKVWKKEPPNAKCCYPGCNRRTTQCHHSEGRLGDRLMDESTWRPFCDDHHTWAELHPDAARALNFTGSRLT